MLSYFVDFPKYPELPPDDNPDERIRKLMEDR